MHIPTIILSLVLLALFAASALNLISKPNKNANYLAMIILISAIAICQTMISLIAK